MKMKAVAAQLLRGERCAAVLHNCRLAAGGGEAFGEEAIREACRAAPYEVSDGSSWIENDRQFALFDEGLCLFADVYDGRFGRLWRVGRGGGIVPEPAISVPFDPDLRQARGDVEARAADHPDLPAERFEALVEAGRELVDGLPAYRARAFLLRAFTVGEVTAGLFATYRVANGVRTQGFGFAGIQLAGNRTSVVQDLFAPPPWRPRF